LVFVLIVAEKALTCSEVAHGLGKGTRRVSMERQLDSGASRAPTPSLKMYDCGIMQHFQVSSSSGSLWQYWQYQRPSRFNLLWRQCSPTDNSMFAVRRHDLGEPCVPSLFPTPEGWISHIHPQGWVYFYHPKMRVVTNDDIRTPNILNTLERYLATYPFSDLADGMELRVPYDPQPNEHMFSLIINHKSCMAGYNAKDVISSGGMKADHGAFNPMDVYTLLTRIFSEQTAKDVLELP
jgi:hypothetical protein